jgi:hypothetical protein
MTTQPRTPQSNAACATSTPSSRTPMSRNKASPRPPLRFGQLGELARHVPIVDIAFRGLLVIGHIALIGRNRHVYPLRSAVVLADGKDQVSRRRSVVAALPARNRLGPSLTSRGYRLLARSGRRARSTPRSHSTSAFGVPPLTPSTDCGARQPDCANDDGPALVLPNSRYQHGRAENGVPDRRLVESCQDGRPRPSIGPRHRPNKQPNDPDAQQGAAEHFDEERSVGEQEVRLVREHNRTIGCDHRAGGRTALVGQPVGG